MILMDRNSAKTLAQKEFIKLLERRRDLAKVAFEPIKFRNETDSFWVFYAASPELQAEGCAPGAVFFTIDKIDGHLWNENEMERFYQITQPEKLIA